LSTVFSIDLFLYKGQALWAALPRDSGLTPGKWEENFLFCKMGPTHPTIQWVPGALSPEVQRPLHEAQLSPTCPTPPIVNK